LVAVDIVAISFYLAAAAAADFRFWFFSPSFLRKRRQARTTILLVAVAFWRLGLVSGLSLVLSL
jgi:hypothetical protein